ncbi:MAG: ABC transporter permease [Treponema sp.]|jgi:ribose transport system permease protein|nr:ABC transporter permease [Treponema sp.]
MTNGNIAHSILKTISSKKESTVILIVIVLFLIVSISKPIFLSGDNLRTTFIGMACNGIIGIAMVIALISGGFDLSVGSVMGLSAVLIALFARMEINVWIAFVLVLLIGMLIGLINGLLIGKIGINPFITTLGMMSITRGLVFVFTKGQALRLNAGTAAFRFIGSGYVGPIPTIVLIFLLLAICSEFVVRKSSVIMQVFYVGSNEKAAKLSGINVGLVKIFVYIFSAFMASFSGALTLARFNVATANLGSGVEMTVISAAVIGGASLSGGEGSVLGTVFGIVLLSIISNALVLFNVSVHWQNFISGAILLLAVTFDTLSHKRRVKKIAV